MSEGTTAVVHDAFVVGQVQMNEQLDRLRKQFDELQRSLPGPPKKGDGERA